MEKTAAVLLATGYEEGESLFVVDILRRAGIRCDSVSTEGETVTGAQGITVKADKLLDDTVREYDMLILPGGRPGADNLRDNDNVIELVQYFDSREDKYIAAICAAPIVLHRAGITKGRTLTSYPGETYQALFVDSHYKQDIVVVDGHLITSRGPATTLPFAYALVDALGKNSASLKQRMLYALL